jgi:hypothetical protein
MLEVSLSAPYLACDNIALGPEHLDEFRVMYGLAFGKETPPSLAETTHKLGAVFHTVNPHFNPNNIVVGIVDDNDSLVAGACVAKLSRHRIVDPMVIHVRNFCRVRDESTKGAGQFLLGEMYQSAVSTAALAELTPEKLNFCLDVETDNLTLQAFYRKLGFGITKMNDEDSVHMKLFCPSALMDAHRIAKAKFPAFSQHY